MENGVIGDNIPRAQKHVDMEFAQKLAHVPILRHLEEDSNARDHQQHKCFVVLKGQVCMALISF